MHECGKQTDQRTESDDQHGDADCQTGEVCSASFRCVAPDYIGFGRSDKWTEVGAYSFARHFSALERFAEALDHLHRGQQVIAPHTLRSSQVITT